MDVKVVVEFAVAALIAIGILVGVLIGIQADMCRTLYIILDENISIRKIMMKQYIATKVLLKDQFNIDIDDYDELYDKIINNTDTDIEKKLENDKIKKLKTKRYL
jgi:hypothetical protein